MNVGAVVYYRTNSGARFGHLVEGGHKWARVRHGDVVRRVPLADVKPCPPEKVDTPAKMVKRGAA